MEKRLALGKGLSALIPDAPEPQFSPTELDIDRSRTEALVRPESFNRSELHFHITRSERDGDTNAALRGTINALPDAIATWILGSKPPGRRSNPCKAAGRTCARRPGGSRSTKAR